MLLSGTSQAGFVVKKRAIANQEQVIEPSEAISSQVNATFESGLQKTNLKGHHKEHKSFLGKIFDKVKHAAATPINQIAYVILAIIPLGGGSR